MTRVYELRTAHGRIEARAWRRPLPPGIRLAGGRVMAASHSAESNGFDLRVLSRRVDLVQRIAEGVPPIEYLPQADGMLVKGKRHLIAAPRKEGKSIAMLVQWARMALAGSKVIILDRENGADEYARRLDDIMTAWSLRPADKKRIQANLHYYEFPALDAQDGPEFAVMAEGASVVVFDSQRMFLADLGLKEDASDDYASFMQVAVEPLFQAGVATVILDNTGHGDKSRSRGTSAKGDLNEVLFTLKADPEFSRARQGKVRLTLAPGNSRFGNEGEWEMHIGGGAFTEWRRIGEEKPIDPTFRAATETALAEVGVAGLSQTALLRAVREMGVSFANEDGREWLYRLAADPDVAIDMDAPDMQGKRARFYGGPGNGA